MNLPVHIHKLFHEVRGNLAAIGQRLASIQQILEKQKEATDEEYRRRAEKEEQREREAQFESVADNEKTTKSERQRVQTTQEVIAVAACATFVAVCAYTAASLSQLRQMGEQTAQLYRQAEIENAGAAHRAAETFRQLNILQGQARAARDQATAAKQSADIAYKTFSAVHRPFIGPSGTRVYVHDRQKRFLQFAAGIKNFSSLPGHNLMVDWEVFYNGAPPVTASKVPDIPSDLFPGQELFLQAYFESPVYEEVFSSKKIVEVEVWGRYEGPDGRRYSFCSKDMFAPSIGEFMHLGKCPPGHRYPKHYKAN